MSDVFEGPGWWMASDGLWYAPDLHADSAYRAEFHDAGSPKTDTVGNGAVDRATLAEVAERSTPDDFQDAPADEQRFPVLQPVEVESTSVVFPAVELSSAPAREPSRGVPVSEILKRASVPLEVPTKVPVDRPTDGWSDKPPSSDSIFPIEESTADQFTVSRPWGANVPDVPRFEAATPASVVEAPGSSPPIGSPVVADSTAPEPGRARLDLPGVHGPSAGTPAPSSHFRFAEAGPAMSTDLVPIPELTYPVRSVALFDRVVAGVLFASGLALIVGTFLAWTSDPVGSTTGWARGDGLATILCGVLGSSAAGPIFVGFRHLVPKTVAIASGVVAAAVMGLVAADTLSDSSVAGTNLSMGFWLALLASFTMIAAGIADRSLVTE